MAEPTVVHIDLDDYHRWIGELYVQVRERDKAIAVLSPTPPVTPPVETR